MTTPTFEDLRKAAARLPIDHEVVTILSDAEINANDTLHTEKACNEDDWEKIALNSIGCLFDKHTKPATLRWFKQRGYRW